MTRGVEYDDVPFSVEPARLNIDTQSKGASYGYDQRLSKLEFHRSRESNLYCGRTDPQS